MKKYLITILFILSLAPLARADLNTGLVTWLNFDQRDTDFVNNSIFSRGTSVLRNSLVNMNSSNIRMGLFGQAVNFTNTSAQYVDFNVSPIPSGSKTISFWINVASTTNNGMYILTSYDGAGNNNGTKILRNAGGTLSIGWTSGITITSTASVGTSTWAFVTAVLSTSQTGAIWINGVKSISASISTESSATNRYRMCGRWATANTGSAVMCQAYIDDFRVYNRLLTDQEIIQLYHQGKSRGSSSRGLGSFMNAIMGDLGGLI